MHSRLLRVLPPQERLLLQRFSPHVCPALGKAAVGWHFALQSDLKKKKKSKLNKYCSKRSQRREQAFGTTAAFLSGKTPSPRAAVLDPYEHSWGLAQAPQSLLHTKTRSKQQQKLFENSGLLVTTPV